MIASALQHRFSVSLNNQQEIVSLQKTSFAKPGSSDYLNQSIRFRCIQITGLWGQNPRKID